MSSTSRDRLIIGVDFGTTYSGVAFTYSGDPESPDEIQVVKNWPGSNNITSYKVPSEMTYDSSSQLAGTKRDAAGQPINDGAAARKIRWGLQLKPDEPRLRCLKLRLDPRQKLPSYVSEQDLFDQLHRCGKTSEEAITDYLTQLYRYALDALKARFPQMISTTQIDIILTVPAVWTDAAKEATFRVAEKTGMGSNLFMISEPEAAAIYSLKSMDQKQKLLHVGDNFIVCDAGGGTVDLISYGIRSLSPLRLEESAPGTGALCGGVFLNIKFQELVKSRMGCDNFEAFCRRKPKSWPIALKYFEDYVKRNFDPMDSQTEYDDNKFNVPLPGASDDPSVGIEDGFITLSIAEVAELFRPLVNSIIELIERQRNVLAAYGKTAKGVILVGGFGQSNYLYRCLKTRFADEDPPPLYTQMASEIAPESQEPRFVVMQPENSWTAVVRGAVLSGLEDKLVASRKARRHYGIRCSVPFDASKHSIKNRYWDDLYCAYRAGSQIAWHVKKGQSLPTTQPILLDFTYTRNSRPASVDWEIIVSDEDGAPREFEPTVETRILCHLDVDLTGVPARHFEQCTSSNGTAYLSLDHDIGLKFESGRLVFDLRVDGVVYGTVKANYE